MQHTEEPRRWRFLRRFWLDALLLAGVVWGVHAWQAPEIALDELPALEGRVMDGRVLSAVDSNEPTLLYFWATWCGVCGAQSPVIEALSTEARVLSVASRSGRAAEVQRVLSEADLHFPVLLDADGSLAARFGVRAFPTTFVIDTEGNATAVEVGYTTLWGLRLRMWWAAL